MNSKDTLVGHNVALYLDGGWSISGKVVRAEEARVLIEKDGLIYMIYRDKISAICLNHKENANTVVKRQESTPPGPTQYLQDEDEYSGLSLPYDLLTEEARKDVEDNDFSVFFARPEIKK